MRGMIEFMEIEVRRIVLPVVHESEARELEWLADNPFNSKRVCRLSWTALSGHDDQIRCSRTHLDRRTVKELAQGVHGRAAKRRTGTPLRRSLESTKFPYQGHTYRIVVSDLLRRRPTWFGGEDRSEQSMDEFHKRLGQEEQANQGLR